MADPISGFSPAMALPHTALALPRTDVIATADARQVREVAVEFEAVFIAQMLEQMTSGLETDETFGGGHGETVFRSMLNEHYGQAIAQRGGIGIADAIEREILKLQEKLQ